MEEVSFTLLDEGRVSKVQATVVSGRIRLKPAALKAALGWELKPQGLCKDDRCVTTGGRKDLVTEQGIDLAAFAELVSRPLAAEPQAGVACVGASATDRAERLQSLEAPDFALPDLAGRIHRLSDYRGKKVLLVAYASW